ncbi:MFS transporter [Niameybacter massiliensis]|uniref:MFS transporter n=2 Tax=Holtiella tumoricola TaxID=3018743 RepID=A0AA42J2U7_9FIRM|nr:MFS transporter [Holtiella tumoricola]MDA3733967.1 MFS transporter [Holtiella tumoricola]
MEYTYKHTLKACYFGYITQAIVNNLAPILFIIFQNQFQISLEMLGRLILINFATQIVVDILTVKYVDRMGYRKATVIAHICCALGLISLGVLPKVLPYPYIGLMIAVVLYAIGGGIIEVLVSPIVEFLPGDEKASAMSLLHSFYCWGQVGVVLISTLLLKLIGGDLWFVLPILWALIPLYNVTRFLKVPIIEPHEEEKSMSVKELLSTKGFVIALLLMLAAGASELTMSQWSSLFAEQGLQVPKVMGDLLGPCLFAVLMGAGRMIYGIWGSKINLNRALLGSGILCILCYVVTVFATNPFVSLLGCAVCGLSVSLMWPGTFSLTASTYPRGGTAMFGILAVFGDVGAAVGPWMAGVVSDVVGLGLKAGLLVAMIFPILLVIGILMIKKINDKQKIGNF